MMFLRYNLHAHVKELCKTVPRGRGEEAHNVLSHSIKYRADLPIQVTKPSLFEDYLEKGSYGLVNRAC